MKKKKLQAPIRFGFDYAGTINRHPEVWEFLIRALIEAGHEVYIITGLDRSRRDRRIEALRKNPVAYTKVIPVIYHNREETPALKWAVIKKLGIKFFVDDRLDICEYIRRKGAKHGVVVLNSFTGLGNFQDISNPIELNQRGQHGLTDGKPSK